MKIKNIELFTYTAGWREWSFIKITTNLKFIGWAECTDTFKNLNGFTGILKDFNQLIIDENSLNINRIIWKLKTKSKSNPGSLVQRVISAVENALWDLNGKYYNKSVHELFGNKKRMKIETYWSHCGTTRVRTPQFLDKPAIKSLNDVKLFCQEVNKTNFKTIKTNLALFKNGPKIYMPGHVVNFENPKLFLKNSDFKEIIAWINELNNHLRKDIFIAVDLNFNFNLKSLIRLADNFKKFRIKWLEIDTLEFKVLKSLKKKTNIPIVTGETIMELNSLKSFIDNKCLDMVSIDLPWTGLTESKKIADYCKLNNYKVMTHNYNGYLGTLMSANLAAIISNFYLGEIDIDEAKGVEKIFTTKLDLDGKYLNIPTKPGWGCDLVQKKLNKFYSAKN